MRKEWKQILLICLFLIIGCVLGYFVALNQINQLSNPEYIEFWICYFISTWIIFRRFVD